MHFVHSWSAYLQLIVALFIWLPATAVREYCANVSVALPSHFISLGKFDFRLNVVQCLPIMMNDIDGVWCTFDSIARESDENDLLRASTEKFKTNTKKEAKEFSIQMLVFGAHSATAVISFRWWMQMFLCFSCAKHFRNKHTQRRVRTHMNDEWVCVQLWFVVSQTRHNKSLSCARFFSRGAILFFLAGTIEAECLDKFYLHKINVNLCHSSIGSESFFVLLGDFHSVYEQFACITDCEYVCGFISLA